MTVRAKDVKTSVVTTGETPRITFFFSRVGHRLMAATLVNHIPSQAAEPERSGRALYRLSDASRPALATGFASVAPLPSNAEALQACALFSQGLQSLLVVSGPAGWGRTALLDATASTMALESGETIAVRSAIEWARSRERADSLETLILDDLQDAWRHPRARQLLRTRLERRVRHRRPTLVSIVAEPGGPVLASLLPHAREWRVARIGHPESVERALVAQRLARIEELEISQEVAQFMGMHLNGSARSIRGALQRLRLVKSNWTCRDDVCRACGVLMPYVLGENGWDPRDAVHDAILRVMSQSEDWAGSPSLRDLSAYLMVTLTGLTEGDVATFLKVTPSSVYRRCQAVKKRLDEEWLVAKLDECRAEIRKTFVIS